MKLSFVHASLAACICASTALARGPGGAARTPPIGKTEFGEGLVPRVNKLAESGSKPRVPAFAGPSDGQWPSPGQNVALTRYSGLDEITPDNASKLQVVAYARRRTPSAVR